MKRNEGPDVPLVTDSFTAKVPVMLTAPQAMHSAIIQVLDGEYEAGFSGQGLTILDLGANVGAFAIWADMRWPGSIIHCYEPQPETYALLLRNTAGRANIQCHQRAVSATLEGTAEFWSRHVGDGESGLAHFAGETFESGTPAKGFVVDLLNPADLPQADIVKIDVEGAEADILLGMDLDQTSLVILEYQNDRNRQAIKDHMQGSFDLVMEDAFLWDDLLRDDPSYARSLAGDHWGHMRFVTRNSTLDRLSRDMPAIEQVPLGKRIARKLKRVWP